jgi:hypothetical protein
MESRCKLHARFAHEGRTDDIVGVSVDVSRTRVRPREVTENATFSPRRFPANRTRSIVRAQSSFVPFAQLSLTTSASSARSASIVVPKGEVVRKIASGLSKRRIDARKFRCQIGFLLRRVSLKLHGACHELSSRRRSRIERAAVDSRRNCGLRRNRGASPHPWCICAFGPSWRGPFMRLRPRGSSLLLPRCICLPDLLAPFCGGRVQRERLPQLHEGEDATRRVKDAYLPAGYERLRALKRQYDPDNLFRFSYDLARRS